MFKFEIPRNVHAVRSFLGLTLQGWLWTIASSSISGSIVFIFTFNPVITIITIVFAYYFIRTTFEIDVRTGEPKISVLIRNYGSSKTKKTFSIRWGNDENHEKTTIRTFIKSK